MHDLLETVAGAGVDGGQTPSAEAWSARAWFAGGERIGYAPRSRAIVASEDAPLRVFLRREGDPRMPFPSCLDFLTAHSGGRRFDRICRTQPRCRNSSSTMSAWATATSLKTTLIRPP